MVDRIEEIRMHLRSGFYEQYPYGVTYAIQHLLAAVDEARAERDARPEISRECVESDRARRVGEAVIEAVSGWHEAHFASDVKHLAESGFPHSSALMRVIDEALRAHAARAGKDGE